MQTISVHFLAVGSSQFDDVFVVVGHLGQDSRKGLVFFIGHGYLSYVAHFISLGYLSHGLHIGVVKPAELRSFLRSDPISRHVPECHVALQL